MVESDQLALNSSVPPGGILAGHLQHQGSDRRWGGWSAWSSVWVGPASGDEVVVPAQQRAGRDQPHPAQRDRQQPAARLPPRPDIGVTPMPCTCLRGPARDDQAGRGPQCADRALAVKAHADAAARLKDVTATGP